jgi:hypothetical protein
VSTRLLERITDVSKKQELPVFSFALPEFSGNVTLDMTEAEVDDALAALEDQFRKDREAFLRIKEVLRRNSPTGKHSESSEEKAMLIKDRIAKYILEIDSNFTISDVKSRIERRAPEFANRLRDDALSAALARLKNERKIEVVVPKKGNSAAVYTTTKKGLMKLTK